MNVPTSQYQNAIAQAYLPINRGYFAAFSLYYAAITVLNILTETGTSLIFYTSMSATSCALIWIMRAGLDKNDDLTSIERKTMAVNAIVLFNILVVLQLLFAEAKLIYLLIATMVFALSSVTIRQSVIACSITLSCLGWYLWSHGSDQIIMYGFVSFGAAMGATGVSYHLRRAIGTAAMAELAAQNARSKAEENLDHEKSAKQILKKESLSDSLTGLPNRRAFFETIKKRSTDPSVSWLVLLDLDGFKLVNDTYGHIMGDELLKSVSFRLRMFCGEEAHVSRMGGDEFALIFRNNRSEKDQIARLEKLLVRLSKNYPIDGRLIQVSASIGCCRIGNEESASVLLKNADFALLYSKKSGKNRVTSFNDEHAVAFARYYQIEHALRGADFDQEIELVFQPQYDLRSHDVARAEVLARWHSPTLGTVEPNRFITVAEDCGLMHRISLAVVEKAIAQLEAWEHPISLSINLSASDLNSSETTQAIINLLDEHQVDPDLIEFEVTETAMLTDMEKASKHVRLLADRGHAIAIDDFGTGYSNFTNLRALPITKLKIDRSFVENLEDPMTEKILRSMVGMAKTLEVQCLLEGVEDELGMVIAKRSGMELVQGFLIGHPVSADDLQQHLTQITLQPTEPEKDAAA